MDLADALQNAVPTVCAPAGTVAPYSGGGGQTCVARAPVYVRVAR